MRIAKYGLALLALVFSCAAAASQNDDSNSDAAADHETLGGEEEEVPVGYDFDVGLDHGNPEDEEEVVPGAYLVELSGAGAVDALYEELRAEGLKVEARIKEFNFRNYSSFQLTNTIDDDGAAYSADPETEAKHRAKIRGSAYVKNVWPVHSYQMSKSNPLFTDLASLVAGPARQHERRQPRSHHHLDRIYSQAPHIITQVDQLRAKGLTGKGTLIGIIDSGIDYTHPALGGCFGKDECLVTKGFDFVGNEFKSNKGNTKMYPNRDPRDCYGHGTHIAGIIAAQKNELGFTGVAPGVKLAAYKIMGCVPITYDDVLLKAIERAVDDGVSMIVLANGAKGSWATSYKAAFVDDVVERGIPVIAAPGNMGLEGVWSTGDTPTARKATTIGSVQNPMTPFVVFSGIWSADDGGDMSFTYQKGEPSILQTDIAGFTLWAAPGDACELLPDDTPDLSEMIILLHWTNCPPQVQARNVAAKGGKYVIFHGRSK